MTARARERPVRAAATARPHLARLAFHHPGAGASRLSIVAGAAARLSDPGRSGRSESIEARIGLTSRGSPGPPCEPANAGIHLVLGQVDTDDNETSSCHHPLPSLLGSGSKPLQLLGEEGHRSCPALCNRGSIPFGRNGLRSSDGRLVRKPTVRTSCIFAEHNAVVTNVGWDGVDATMSCAHEVAGRATRERSTKALRLVKQDALRADPIGLVPLAGIEPALLAELDFESSASTSSATGAFASDRRDEPAASEAGGL